MKPTKEMLDAGAFAAMVSNCCGVMVGDERVMCDDERLGENKEERCSCREDFTAGLIAALSASPAGVGVETVRHKKRGTTYEVIGVGKMQAEIWTEEVLGADEDGRNAWVNQSIDMREVTIYRSTDDGQIWVRPVEEFNDGRFERAALKGDEQ